MCVSFAGSGATVRGQDSAADRPSPGCSSPGSAAPERLASVRGAVGVERCRSQAIRSKYCSFRALHIKLQLKSTKTNTRHHPVDQPGFSAEFSKWFSKLRHCTFAPTVRCNDDKSENYHLQTVCWVYSLDPGLFLLIYFHIRVSFAGQQDGWKGTRFV